MRKVVHVSLISRWNGGGELFGEDGLGASRTRFRGYAYFGHN